MESQMAAVVDPREGEMVNAEGEQEARTSDVEAMVEDEKEDETLPEESQAQFASGTMEAEEEDALTNHGEVPTSQNAGELHDLEDPAVMSAVRGQRLLEVRGKPGKLPLVGALKMETSCRIARMGGRPAGCERRDISPNPLKGH